MTVISRIIIRETLNKRVKNAFDLYTIFLFGYRLREIKIRLRKILDGFMVLL